MFTCSMDPLGEFTHNRCTIKCTKKIDRSKSYLAAEGAWLSQQQRHARRVGEDRTAHALDIRQRNPIVTSAILYDQCTAVIKDLINEVENEHLHEDIKADTDEYRNEEKRQRRKLCRFRTEQWSRDG